MFTRSTRWPIPLGYGALHGADRGRQTLGRLLDAVGAGPQTTPGRLSEPAPGVRLRAWGEEDASGPVVLLVPAPIKRWYIWDLQPEVSVVARLVGGGMRVFLAEWTDARPDHADRGLEEHVEELLLPCVEEVRERTGAERALLVGHSLGGTFAAILAARHAELVAGLVLLESPLRFGADAGDFAPLVAAAPHAGWLRSPRGAIPGSFLNAVSAIASPKSFQLNRYADLALSAADPGALLTHLRVERWSLDEFAMPNQLLEDVVERLYRRDELMAGTLTIAGKRVGPSSLTAPMLTVLDPRSSIVPPRSMLAFHEAAAAPRKQVLHYHGDVGVALQHVGVLVGRRAHRELWPELLRQMADAWSR